MEKFKLLHEELLQEEGISVSELPVELQKKIKGFNLMMRKLENNPDDEKLYLQLKRQTTKLGDEIQDFIEYDYEEDNDDEDTSKSKGGEKVDKKSKDSKKEDDEDDDDDEDDESKKSAKNKSDKKPQENNQKIVKKAPVGRFGNPMMEKKILSIMDARGDKRIKISDLQAIIGKEPSYPEQQVNNIKLRKVFLSSDYRLVD
jgi:hypothetical protein